MRSQRESDSESDSDTDNDEVCDVVVGASHEGGANEISEVVADMLYREAGSPYTEQNNEEMRVVPKPFVLYSEAEKLISEAKCSLNINFALEAFQIQALLGTVMFCKIIIFYMSLKIVCRGGHYTEYRNNFNFQFSQLFESENSFNNQIINCTYIL